MNSGWESEVRSLLEQGKKIDAIKVYRQQTGLGLAEAKAAVEAMAEGTSLQQQEISPALIDEVCSVLENTGKIAAIKLYRDRTNAGLAEGKKAVEAIIKSRGITPAPSGGCFTAVAFFVCLTAGGYALVKWCC